MSEKQIFQGKFGWVSFLQIWSPNSGQKSEKSLEPISRNFRFTILLGPFSQKSGKEDFSDKALSVFIIFRNEKNPCSRFPNHSKYHPKCTPLKNVNLISAFVSWVCTNCESLPPAMIIIYKISSVVILNSLIIPSSKKAIPNGVQKDYSFTQ